MHGTLSEKLLIFSKKIKCSKQPKKQNKFNFFFHLMESQTFAVVGWGPMFGTKSQKNGFFDTFPKEGADMEKGSLWQILCSSKSP